MSLQRVKQRPELTIKVYPEDMVVAQKLTILQKLRETNALILNLQESIKSNTTGTLYPFITFKRVSSSEKLPSNLKRDGDPLSDFFITLKTYRNNNGSGGRSDNDDRKSGFVLLAFKVHDDDQTTILDASWEQWSGAAILCKMLSKHYEIRKVVCFKGVNIVPDVFKYFILIEYLMSADENDDSHCQAKDCMQKFRIDRMSGYAALYQDFHSKEIEEAINEIQNLE